MARAYLGLSFLGLRLQGLKALRLDVSRASSVGAIGFRVERVGPVVVGNSYNFRVLLDNKM